VSKRVVEIIQDGLYRAGQPAQVFIHDGDTVEFKNGDSGTTLVLTEQARSILSPTPGATVEIAVGASATFEVRGVSQSTYCCQVLAAGSSPEPINCESAGAGAILSILSSETRSADQRTGRGL
jgi:hypothetical protein